MIDASRLSPLQSCLVEGALLGAECCWVLLSAGSAVLVQRCSGKGWRLDSDSGGFGCVRGVAAGWMMVGGALNQGRV